jgi:hypothetical protein
MPKEFKPPKHTETHVYVFDRRTGEIVATHTRWIDVGAEPAGEDVGGELLESIAKDSDRSVKDLDLLKTKPRRSGGALRVDVKARKLIVDRRPKHPEVFVAEPLRQP